MLNEQGCTPRMDAAGCSAIADAALTCILQSRMCVYGCCLCRGAGKWGPARGVAVARCVGGSLHITCVLHGCIGDKFQNIYGVRMHTWGMGLGVCVLHRRGVQSMAGLGTVVSDAHMRSTSCSGLLLSFCCAMLCCVVLCCG